MVKFKAGDTVFLKNTFEKGTVTEIISELDYFIVWMNGERGIFNEIFLFSLSEEELPLFNA